MAILENKKIYFDYEILEKLEAGIELLGTEVKSLRSGKGSLVGSYVIIRGGEAYASGMDIAAYQEKNARLAMIQSACANSFFQKQKSKDSPPSKPRKA
jgi:tmRNA-binding protein